MGLTFHTLDVFTKVQFGGNPLAVVLGADDLEPDQMQQIAAEFNLSETVFVLKPEQPAHTAKMRIFTPKAELPFAGHPTVGTAVLLAELRAKVSGGGQDQLVSLEQPVGIVRVGVKLGKVGGEASFAEFDGPKVPGEVDEAPSDEEICQALGLIPRELNFANHRATVFDGGATFLFVPVSSREVLARARPQLSYWTRSLANAADVGVFAYCKDPEHNNAHYRARMFAPAHGIMEDPATGGAAAAFTGVIQRFDQLPNGMHRRRIEQGYEMGRPSQIDVSLEIEGGRLAGLRVGGAAVRVSSGELQLRGK